MSPERRRLPACANLRLLLALAIVLQGAIARADEAPSEIDKDAARTLVQQGDERLAAEDYRGALEAYQRADDIMGVPTTAIEVGKVQLKLGHLVEAKTAFDRAAAYPEKLGEPLPFTKAREQARKLAEEVAPRISWLRLTITSEAPRDAITVTIDEEPVEAWASAIAMNPGLHVVTVAAPGFVTATEELVLSESEKRALDLSLRAEPQPEPTKVLVTAEPERSLWPMAYTGFAVAGVGAIVGAVTGGISLSKASEAKESCDDSGACQPAASEPLAQSRTLAHVSTTSFVIAGVGAALGITGLVLALGEESEVAALLGPTGGALRIRF